MEERQDIDQCPESWMAAAFQCLAPQLQVGASQVELQTVWRLYDHCQEHSTHRSSSSIEVTFTSALLNLRTYYILSLTQTL